MTCVAVYLLKHCAAGTAALPSKWPLTLTISIWLPFCIVSARRNERFVLCQRSHPAAFSECLPSHNSFCCCGRAEMFMTCICLFVQLLLLRGPCCLFVCSIQLPWPPAAQPHLDPLLASQLQPLTEPMQQQRHCRTLTDRIPHFDDADDSDDAYVVMYAAQTSYLQQQFTNDENQTVNARYANKDAKALQSLDESGRIAQGL